MEYDKKIGDVVQALNEGKRCVRGSEYHLGVFIFKQVPSMIDPAIIPKMQSLPQLVKDEFIRRKMDI